MKIIEFVERINEWQGVDAPVDVEMVDSLIWTMAQDDELKRAFDQRVKQTKFDLSVQRALADN